MPSKQPAAGTAFLAALSLYASAIRAQTLITPEGQGQSDFRVGLVRIEEFRNITWRPVSNYFRTSEPVRILIQDADGKESVTLIADDAEGSPDKLIRVQGNLRLLRPEGDLSGRALEYHAETQTGSILDAKGSAAGLKLTGKRIEFLAQQTLRATEGSFTSCGKEHRRDYELKAGELTVTSTGRVRARNVGLWLGGTRILSVPSLQRDFGKTIRNPFPIPAYTKDLGLQYGIGREVISETGTRLDFSLNLSLRKAPIGVLDYEHEITKPVSGAAPPSYRLTAAVEPQRGVLEAHPAVMRTLGEPPPGPRRAVLYGSFSAKQYVYNRQRTDLRVSRLPEAGVSVTNLFNERTSLEAEEAGEAQLIQQISGGAQNWLVNLDIGAGYLAERPTGRETGRLAMRTEVSSPLVSIGSFLYMRGGATAWTNAYATGARYSILSPEAEIGIRTTRHSILGAAYRFQQEYGSTPFLFDRKDVRKELRLRYGHIDSGWLYDLSVRYDLDRRRAYDTGFDIRRRFDCMEVGFRYGARAQGFGIVLNLLPGAFSQGTAKPNTTARAASR